MLRKEPLSSRKVSRRKSFNISFNVQLLKNGIKRFVNIF
jgi:hypothetical protein